MNANAEQKSITEMTQERHNLDVQIRAIRIKRALLKLKHLRENHQAINFKVLAAELMLSRELTNGFHRNIFIDDALEQLELLLDIEE